jgi:UDPglucose--hexose-1-phosphate uridylyltransferase
MSELRKDPVSGRWVIISVERGKRPSDFGVRIPPKKLGFCAFCSGNEHTTPPEIIAVRPDGSEPNSSGWSIRVVPNKFPALHIESQLRRIDEGIYHRLGGVGAHEVIIESPDHHVTLSTLPQQSLKNVLWIFYKRISDLKKDTRLKYALIFKNEGDAAGASLEHTHTQLIALPIVTSVFQQ